MAVSPRILLRLARSGGVVALLDQICVSGCRFAISLIIGRAAGAESLGAYVLAFAVVVFASVSMETLVSRPFQVFTPHMKERKRRLYAGSTLVHLAGLSFLAAAGCLAAAAVAGIGDFLPALWTEIAAALAIALPGILLWEYVRRFAFAHMEMFSAFVIDATLTVLQLGTLVILARLNLLSAASALVIIGAASAVVGAAALFHWRDRFRFAGRRFRRDMQRNWVFGRWLFAGQVVGTVQSYVVVWLLALTVSAEATGILTACHTIVLLTNPLLLGVANWLGPAAAGTYAASGILELERLLLRVGMLLLGGTLAFVAAMFVVGENVLVLLYGDEYAGNGLVVGMTSLAALGFGGTIIGSSGLAALARTRVIFVSGAVGTVVTLVSFFPAVTHFGLSGAGFSISTGSLAAASILLVALAKNIRSAAVSGRCVTLA